MTTCWLYIPSYSNIFPPSEFHSFKGNSDGAIASGWESDSQDRGQQANGKMC